MIPVSICINTRNRRKELELALPSVLAQGPREVIIVDDGSTDGSKDVIQNCIARFPAPSVTYHLLPDTGYNLNPGGSMNTAIALSTQPVVIQQNAEIVSVNGTFQMLLDDLQPRSPILARVFNVPFPRVQSLPAWGTSERAQVAAGHVSTTWEDVEPYNSTVRPWTNPQVYCGWERQRPLFFLGAMTRELWDELGGYDETVKDGADRHLEAKMRLLGTVCRGSGTAIAYHIQHGRT